jgi:PhoH-like ATPase
MQYSQEIFDLYDKVYMCGWVLRELEKHKQSDNEEKKYLSRQATNNIEANKDKVIYFISECNYDLPSHLDKNIMDNKIISNFKEIYDKDNSIKFLSNDTLFRHNCKSIGIPCEKFGIQDKNDLKNIYKGYKRVILNDFELASFYECQSNKWDMIENEYLIIQNENKETIDIRKWTSKGFIEIKPLNIKGIKPKNDLQICTFDLMNSTNIPIRILLGRSGSGKTYINLKTALYFLDKGKFERIIYVRNPTGKGERLGYLPGSKQEKLDPYSQGIIDNLDMGEMQFKQLISQERLQCESPNFMKGASKESSWFLVDEAEDLDIDTLKLIGTRVAKDSNICFSGDLYQTEKQYKYNNGLIEFINKYKGHPLVGIIKLEEDVRSEVSKLFGDL